MFCTVIGSTMSINDNQEAIGYGYEVKNTKVVNYILSASLQLIQNSNVYGPDIQLLSLTARYL